MPPTARGKTRAAVWEFVRGRLRAGDPPTLREVRQAFGFAAVETARKHLDALVAEGKLVKAAGAARGYRLAQGQGTGPDRPRRIPLLGEVQAGSLTLALESPDGFLSPWSTGPGEEDFALRVRGESMIGAGIRPGDVVIVRRQAVARSGDIVVAAVDDEATVKRLKIRGGRYELHPENPEFPVIHLKNPAGRILGKVVEVRRFLEGVPLEETP